MPVLWVDRCLRPRCATTDCAHGDRPVRRREPLGAWRPPQVGSPAERPRRGHRSSVSRWDVRKMQIPHHATDRTIAAFVDEQRQRGCIGNLTVERVNRLRGDRLRRDAQLEVADILLLEDASWAAVSCSSGERRCRDRSSVAVSTQPTNAVRKRLLSCQQRGRTSTTPGISTVGNFSFEGVGRRRHHRRILLGWRLLRLRRLLGRLGTLESDIRLLRRAVFGRCRANTRIAWAGTPGRLLVPPPGGTGWNDGVGLARLAKAARAGRTDRRYSWGWMKLLSRH